MQIANADHQLPPSAGVRRTAPETLAGGSPEENAARLLDVLAGQAGPITDIVALNAGAALYIGGKATSIAAGVERFVIERNQIASRM